MVVRHGKVGGHQLKCVQDSICSCQYEFVQIVVIYICNQDFVDIDRHLQRQIRFPQVVDLWFLLLLVMSIGIELLLVELLLLLLLLLWG